ncbi:MAG: 23S rRNA (cytidine(2498)-2'-O)-methyltransferase RlmM [Gammaproteobacteria bacterium]|nr:23S rRNA (cytidine(2498)-2'-O)-methyltransferase RlmM [Gammaproteobacteria bacterium]
MIGVFLYCRTGFEGECAAEMQDQAAKLGIAGFAKAKPDSGYVVFQCYVAEDVQRLVQELRFEQLIFVRQWFVLLALCNELDVTDRVSGLLETLQTLPQPASKLWLETPDTNEAKELQALCRSLHTPLTMALKKRGLLREAEHGGIAIHVCFMSSHAAYVGYMARDNNSPWSMGIPRLRFPRQAPSRSTLKLDEAILCLLTPAQQRDLFKPGMRAVDLGACPGGWTWQLVSRGLHVTAIDNGAIDEGIMATGQVEHLRADGFRFRPEQRVDWLVCDIVEQPIRIADLMAQWLAEGWCRYAIFNLKLPMKKRYLEVVRCLELVQERLCEAGIEHQLRAKQLYHDREEITVCVTTQRR